MTTLAFDTHKAVKALRAAGIVGLTVSLTVALVRLTA